MSKRISNPMPTVTYEGKTYKLRSRTIIAPNFNTMDHLSILLWLNRNTTAKGYNKDSNPLVGLGEVLTINRTGGI